MLTENRASNYQNEESEQWIGEWMETRGVRDQIVLATKYTTGFRTHRRDAEIQSNFVGNNAKSLRVSVEASLRKLRTDYIDLVRFLLLLLLLLLLTWLVLFCFVFVSGGSPCWAPHVVLAVERMIEEHANAGW